MNHIIFIIFIVCRSHFKEYVDKIYSTFTIYEKSYHHRSDKSQRGSSLLFSL